jgi:hypothetical protein
VGDDAVMMYLFVRHALARQRWGATLATGALFAGAAVIGVGLVVDIPGILMLLGAGALLGAVGVAAVKRRAGKIVGALVLGLLVAVLPRLVGWIWDLFDDDEQRADNLWKFIDRIEPVVVVGGLLVAAYLLGRISVEWPERGEDQPAEGPNPP